MDIKKGISLIVLVITIIVMIILAGAIVLTLNNNGIISKAEGAVDATNLNEVQNLASLKWAEAYLDEKTTQEELEQYVLTELQEAGIKTENYTITVTEKGVTVTANNENGDNVEDNVSGDTDTTTADPALNPSGIIPDGATYVAGDTTYNSGDAFPATVNIGDVYKYGDYEYTYCYYFDANGGLCWMPFENLYDNGLTGWGVMNKAVYDSIYGGGEEITETTFGQIMESINGKPIVSLFSTFYGCNALTTAPNIPSGVVDMNYAFMYCNSLSGTITINTNPTLYDHCFYNVDMSKITLAGTCTVKQELANTGKNADQVTIVD